VIREAKRIADNPQAATLLHNAKDGMQRAASGAGYLGNAVANDFKSAVAAANPSDIPPDID